MDNRRTGRRREGDNGGMRRAKKSKRMLKRRKRIAFQKTGRPGAKADLAGEQFFRLPQSDKRVFRWPGKGVGQCREVLLPLPPRP